MTAYEWNNSYDYSAIENERMWVIIKGEKQDIAVGLIYMAVDGSSTKDWNDELEGKISGEIQLLKEEGKCITLVGDFNGHIKSEDGGVIDGDNHTDTNGGRVINLRETHELKIVNIDPLCTGNGHG